MDKEDQIYLIFKSYNTAVGNLYDVYMRNSKALQQMKRNEFDYEKAEEKIKQGIEEWNKNQISELGGMTPEEYFSALEDFDDVIEHFRAAAVICEYWTPELLLDKLKSYGDRAVDALMQLAADKTLIEDEIGILICVAAIRLLGEWKIGRASGLLVNLMGDAKDQDGGIRELMAEEITAALCEMDESTIEPLMAALNNTDQIRDAEEYLMQALAFIGEKHKNDAIYRCLKSCFLKMENKLLGAIFLADYGDGRAIPALRGYVEKNINTIDRPTFYEIKGSVERLGGSMDDLEVVFKQRFY